MEIHFIANEAHGIVLCVTVFLLILGGIILGSSEKDSLAGLPAGIVMALTVILGMVFFVSLLGRTLFP